jgi:hypothetical protein
VSKGDYSSTQQGRVAAEDQALRLWEGVFQDSTGILALWILDRKNPDKKKNNKTRYFEYPGQAPQAAELAIKESEKGREAYFAAHLLKGKRRKKYNAMPLRALYADADGAVVPPDKPQPGIRVASSLGKEHLYWPLNQELEPEEAEQLNKQVTYAIGADKGGWDLGQVLRIPGTRNYKYEDTPVVELVECDGLAHSPEELREAFPAPSGSAKSKARVVSYESGEPYDEYCGRGKRGTGLKRGKYHNPFQMDTDKEKRDGTREEVIEKFERHLYGPVENYKGEIFDGRHLLADIGELRGKVLCCHCAPLPCHCDVLVRLANATAGDEPPVELDPERMLWWTGEKFKEKDGEIDRSATLLMIGRCLFDAGANRAWIVAALRERDESLGYEKYTGRADDKEYERIMDKLEEEGRGERRHPGDADEEPTEPEMDEAAYRGLAGDVVELIAPHTEADPVALLLTFLTEVGNAVGRRPHLYISATRHHPNLFCAIVGRTSRSRKGTSADPIMDLMRAVDSSWAAGRVISGLSSGEGLIDQIRDERKVHRDGAEVVDDPGVKDKRLMIIEGELAQALKHMRREGNSLSPTLRNAWDGKLLNTMVKHSPLRCTRPHVSVVGHITRAELFRSMTETELENGLANRFLWAVVKRSRKLPFGGEWRKVDVAPVTRRIWRALKKFDEDTEMAWADDGREVWTLAYDTLTQDLPGMFGAVTARAEAQALRLSMIYAILDGSKEIQATHIDSALAVWQYCEDSALVLFGKTVGNVEADAVLRELTTCGEMTRTEVRDLFERNKNKAELDRIKELLLDAGRITIRYEKIAGSRKRSEIWVAA